MRDPKMPPLRDRILEAIDREGPSSVARLAELAEASESGVTGALKTLHKAKLVVRRNYRWSRPGDPRSSTESATGSGDPAWWTPERRQAQREVGAARFNAMIAEHPERKPVIDAVWAAISAGELVRPPCPSCDRAMRPLYDWARLARVGWRCANQKKDFPDA